MRGSPSINVARGAALEVRLEASYIPEPNSGCWLWIAAMNKKSGYGQIHVNGITCAAHRVSYELHKGPIPAGLTIDHKCRTRLCVNPDHLEAVTLAENIQRSPLIKGRPQKTHCPHGHAYTAENTKEVVVAGYATRICLICKRKSAREFARKKRAARV